MVQDSVLVIPQAGICQPWKRGQLSGNVAYDFTGAGFVAEAGHERGEFIGNLVVVAAASTATNSVGLSECARIERGFSISW